MHILSGGNGLWFEAAKLFVRFDTFAGSETIATADCGLIRLSPSIQIDMLSQAFYGHDCYFFIISFKQMISQILCAENLF